MLTHINVENVQEAYAELPRTFAVASTEESRNGPVRVMPGPLVTTYRRPDQRVLMDPHRDANPFFHLMEAFWMLAGRRDVESLMRFNSGMKKYSDDGVTFHGAYGHRWRNHFGQDQLAEIVRLLRINPSDRRIVLQMWDPVVDLGEDGLDFPCNNLCYFRVRQTTTNLGNVRVTTHDGHDITAHGGLSHSYSVLDMTIVCRSNDMVWGGYGANAVHFSVLQEFVAACLGVRIGEMHQVSNNAHVYEATRPERIEPYTGYGHLPVPLFGDLRNVPVADVLMEIEQVWDDYEYAEPEHLPQTTIQLIGGMRMAWDGWKTKSLDRFFEGTQLIADSGHTDWWEACTDWAHRRMEKFA